MTDNLSTQKHVVQHEFTRQATAYAALPSVSDPMRIDRLIQAVDPSPAARVLDVATGPGDVALGFAAQCREVVGIDLTGATLALAEARRKERGRANLHFVMGDTEHLPFENDTFDVVVCRFAFHHFERPAHVLAEMTRLCRPGGHVAVEDLVVSEHAARGAYQHKVEVLRDPSHTRAVPLSEMLALFAAVGLEVENVYSAMLVPGVQQWLATTQAPDDRAQQVYALLEHDEHHDVSGMRPFRRDGGLCFIQHTAAVIGRKLMIG